MVPGKYKRLKGVIDKFGGKERGFGEGRLAVEGKKYDLDEIEFAGWWTSGKDVDTTGYDFFAYFDKDGRFLGSDKHGVEPFIK